MSGYITVEKTDAPYRAASSQIIRHRVNRVIVEKRREIKAPGADSSHSFIFKNAIAEAEHAPDRTKADNKRKRPGNNYMWTEHLVE